MNLASLNVGSKAKITRLPTGIASLTRLREMGVLPGTLIQLVRQAPLGDPLEISVRGSLLSVRRQDAELIEVEEAQ